jgi:hypothetical protein
MNRKDKKGQLSIEMIISLSVLIIIFLGVLVLAGQRQSMSESFKSSMYARIVNDQLANGINQVYLAGDGATRVVYLPDTLQDGSGYNLSVYPALHRTTIEWVSVSDTRTYSAGILTSNITGNISSFSGIVTISRIGGEVTIG